MFNNRTESTENSKTGKKSGGYQRTSTKPVVGTVNSLKSKFLTAIFVFQKEQSLWFIG